MRNYKACVYMRLSKEDINENNSITAQKEIAYNYANKNGITIIKEYEDNGYSGMLDSRPAFNEMICDILNGKVNMVIVKDISRLTRDKNKTGYYTEIFFPDNDIRFVSVTEMIDSGERYEIDDTIMMRGIMNQCYVEDISKKIRAVLDNYKSQGKYVEYYVPYGYKKDEEDKYKVIIDEDVADNVKLIFDMYIQGFSQSQIANKLNDMQELTPKEYKGQKSVMGKWTQDTISRILSDPFYTGKMIINKSKSNIKTKKRKKTPREDWIFVENTHEPIICQEKFEKVEDIRNKKFSKPKVKYEYLLRDLVYCGHCNAKMQYKYRSRTKNHNKVINPPVKDWYYKCRMIYRFPEVCDRGHTIQEKVLNKIVIETLKDKLKYIKIDKATNTITRGYKNINVSYKLLQKYENLKMKIDNNMKILYNDRVEKRISTEKFKIHYNELKEKSKEYENKIEELKKECERNISLKRLSQIIDDFKSGKEFTNEIMKELIEKIKVYEDKKIEIIFKF